MGIKDRRTKLLMTLLLMSDNNFKGVSLNKDICDIFDLTLNNKTVATIKRLLSEELIEEISDVEGKMYKLTAKGFYDVVLNYPVFRFTQEKWDGKWRILSYEIPEKKRELRDALRRVVASWGLGPWHRSFWLTPHPILDSLKKLISEKEESAYIQTFEADHVFGDRNILIEKVWGKTNLENKYRALFKSWHSTLSAEQTKVQKLKKVVTDYVEILRQDPGLPKNLIGEQWIGFEAVNLFREIRNILLSNS